VAPACRTEINSLCRITIHYERNIHPLWGVERPVDADNNGVAEANNRCNSCHQPENAAGMLDVPAGQLDLSDGPSQDEPLHFNSYRELLFGDRAVQLNATMTELEDVCERTEVDPVTMLETCVEFRTVPASMSAAGARASQRFFDTMEGRTVVTVDHSDFMSPGELRLLSEWLDIGAQYFNDPFAAPEN